MITQAESQLTQAEYDFLKSLRNDYTFQVIAHRYNLVFEDAPVFTGAHADETLANFDIVQSPSYIFRVAGTDLMERMDVGTGVWTVLGSFAPPADVYSGCQFSVAYSSGTLAVFAAINTGGVYRCTSTDDGATFSSWTLVGGVVGAPAFYTSDVCNNGTPTASSTFGTIFVAANAFDGNPRGESYWRATGTTGQLQYDLGSGVTKTVKRCVVIGTPRTFTIEASNNGSSWTTLHTVTNDGGASTAERVYTFTNTTAYRYYRINVSAVNGSQLYVYELQFLELSPDSFIAYLKATDINRVHYVIQTAEHHWRLATAVDSGGWGTTSSNVFLPFKPRSMTAINFNGQDLIFIDTEVPGRALETLSNQKLQTVIEAEGGIMVFPFQTTDLVWGDHFWVERVIPMDSYNYRANIKVSALHSQLYLTAYHSTGDSFNSIQSYRCYTSKDGEHWSAPREIVFNHTGTSGFILAETNFHVFAIEKKKVWRSERTLYTGFSGSAVQEDITPYIDKYSTTQSGSFQASLVLSNASGHFENHAFFNENNLIMLEHFVGGWYDGGASMYRVAMTQVDEMTRVEETRQYVLSCEARDRFTWMTDDVQSEQAVIHDSTNIGLDSFTDQGGTNYGGLAHFSTVQGEFETIADTLYLQPAELIPRYGLGYSTFNPDFWNGIVQVRMKVASASAALAGIAIRIKNENYIGIQYVKATDVITVTDYGRSYALQQMTSSTSVGWTAGIATNFYWMRVVSRYNRLDVYTSTDGYTWTSRITLYWNNNRKEFPSVPRQRAYGLKAPIEKGFVGLTGYNPAGAGNTIQFKDFQVIDFEKPLTVEKAFKIFTSFAGIHDTEFGDHYNRGIAGWTLGSGISLTAPSNPPAYYNQSLYDGGDVYQ